MSRRRYDSGTEWEREFGYSRAVRAGEMVFVAGTTAIDTDGEIVGTDDPGVQARFCLRKIAAALREVDAAIDDVVRTRIYITDIAHWPAIAAEHHSVFANIRPAATLVEVSRLVDPGLLVEIEVDAVVDA